MTLNEAKTRVLDLRLGALRRAHCEDLMANKLECLGEAVACEKACDCLCRAAETDSGLDGVADTLERLGKRYSMLCGGIECECEHDSRYYGGQAAGFFKAREALLEDMEENEHEL